MSARTGSERLRPVTELADYLTQVVGRPCDPELLRQALTHRSFAYENGHPPHNERLEFLGDSVLGMVVTDALYRTHPDLPEGQLAKLRAAVVNSRALADVARAVALGDFVLLGRGEETTGGRDKASILADTLEAVIGCLYVSQGLPTATVFVHHLLDPLLHHSASLGAGLDWKTSLQELVAVGGLGVPQYRVEDTGPDHDKVFAARAVVGEEVLGTGGGRSKKEAEQNAAEAAWTLLSERAAAMEAAEPVSADAVPDPVVSQTGDAEEETPRPQPDA